jgi:hypothetical protein
LDFGCTELAPGLGFSHGVIFPSVRFLFGFLSIAGCFGFQSHHSNSFLGFHFSHEKLFMLWCGVLQVEVGCFLELPDKKA